jgi:flagellar biosynthetic protein FliO
MGGSGSELPGMGSSLAVSFISLGLVCVLAYLVLRWLGRRGVGQPSGNIRVLGQCYLEPRRSIYLIEAAGRCFLLGAGDNSVNLLAELDRAAVGDVSSNGEKAAGGFAELLSKALRRRGR